MEENTQKSANLMPMFVSVALIIVVAGAAYYFTQVKNPTDKSTTTTATQTYLTEQEEGESLEADTEVSSGSASPTNEKQKTFKVEARNFDFSIEKMLVKKGDTVKIVFTNSEGMHDWNLDEFNAKTKVLKVGESEEVTFVADKAGEFEYYCSVGQHRQMGMVGTLTVEE